MLGFDAISSDALSSVPGSVAPPVGNTLTALPGAYAITGNAATFTVHRKLSATAGAYAVTGHAATLHLRRKLSVISGSYALTGHPATLRTHRRLTALSGSYAIVGNTAELTYDDGADPRYGRPRLDVAAGNWLPSSGSDLYAMLDEAVADASDYIYTETAGPCEVLLNKLDDPGTDTGQVVRYQAWSDTGTGLIVTLKQDAVVIGSWTHAVLSASPTIYEQLLTPAQCDAITDYHDLRLEMTAL
jgi:hypothetical protein